MSVEDLAQFIYIYGDRLHDPVVRELLKEQFKSKKSGPKIEPEPEPEPEEEPDMEEPEVDEERVW